MADTKTATLAGKKLAQLVRLQCECDSYYGHTCARCRAITEKAGPYGFRVNVREDAESHG
jgi:hypothetical protein